MHARHIVDKLVFLLFVFSRRNKISIYINAKIEQESQTKLEYFMFAIRLKFYCYNKRIRRVIFASFLKL